MQAIKQTVKVKNGRVSLDLPVDFHADEVEVIVLSKDEYELPDDFELSDEQKAMLDERANEPKENYIPADEMMKSLRKKFGNK
jgi:hypothetical protein